MKKKNNPLTSEDIASATVYLISKDGRVFVTNVTDKSAIYFLVATQKFIEIDANKVVQTTIDAIK